MEALHGSACARRRPAAKGSFGAVVISWALAELDRLVL
jgi:hypothetical protein